MHHWGAEQGQGDAKHPPGPENRKKVFTLEPRKAIIPQTELEEGNSDREDDLVASKEGHMPGEGPGVAVQRLGQQDVTGLCKI